MGSRKSNFDPLKTKTIMKTNIRSIASKKAWVTIRANRKKEAQKRSLAAKKAWVTIKANRAKNPLLNVI